MASTPLVSAGEGRGYSLTISVLKCSTFYGLSTPRLMCEEISLFSPSVKITWSDMTKSMQCLDIFFPFFVVFLFFFFFFRKGVMLKMVTFRFK